MSEQEKTTEIPVEDLTITADQGNEVKGGIDYFLKLESVVGESDDSKHTSGRP